MTYFFSLRIRAEKETICQRSRVMQHVLKTFNRSHNERNKMRENNNRLLFWE